MKRRGLGRGLGMGYKNMLPRDSYIHGLSAKGVKTAKVVLLKPDPKSKYGMWDYNVLKDDGKLMTEFGYSDRRRAVKEAKEEGIKLDNAVPNTKSESLVKYNLSGIFEQNVDYLKKLEELDEAGVVSYQNDKFGKLVVKDEIKKTQKWIRSHFPDKIPIEEVSIDWKEGRSKEGEYPKTFKSIEQVNKQLMENSYEAPKGGAYDKHGFTIKWKDGTTYTGRMDVQHPTEPHPDNDMRLHITQFLNYIQKEVKERGDKGVYKKEDSKYAKDMMKHYSLDAKAIANAKVFYKKVHESELPMSIYRELRRSSEEGVIEMPKSLFDKTYAEMSKDKVKIKGDVLPQELERMFAKYNDDGYAEDTPYSKGKNPLATPSGQEKVRKSGTHHTSMSVGDMVKVDGDYYIVADIGFKKVKLLGD